MNNKYQYSEMDDCLTWNDHSCYFCVINRDMPSTLQREKDERRSENDYLFRTTIIP